MRVRSILATAAAAALSASALAFGVVTPDTIAGTATRSGDTVSYSGFANLTPKGKQSMVGTLTGFADKGVADALGIDLTGATIEEYGNGAGLRFTWKVNSMPATGVPEGTRYNWTFASGGQTYQLQVKRTNVASVTTAESPLDHATTAASGGWWYQLRGACTTNYAHPSNPVQGCYHLGFFTGSVDTATGTIVMDLPYEAKDGIGRKVADTFRRGAAITAADSAGSSIAAAGQVGVSNTTTSAYLNGWGSYIGGTGISVALGNATGPTGAWTAVATPGDGSFSGKVTGTGTHLWVRACTGYQQSGVTGPCPQTAIAIG